MNSAQGTEAPPSPKLVLIFAQGVMAELARTVMLPRDASWEPPQEQAGSCLVDAGRLVEAVAEFRRERGEGWTFLLALDSLSGEIVARAADMGDAILDVAQASLKEKGR